MEIGDRIRSERERKGLTQQQLADLVGVAQPTVNNWEKDGHKPSRPRIKKLAIIFGKPPEWFEFGIDPVINLDTLPVIGFAQAGQWQEAVELPRDEWIWISVPHDPRYQGVSRFGLAIRGPSMNEVYPEGTIAICVKLADIEYHPTSGDRLVIYRRNEHGQYEATVKELLLKDDRAWLLPRSSDPEHRQPIEVPNTDDFGNEHVWAHALVIGRYQTE